MKNMKFDESIVFLLQIFIVIFSIHFVEYFMDIGFKSVANLLKMSPNIERVSKNGILRHNFIFYICQCNHSWGKYSPFWYSKHNFSSLCFYYCSMLESIIQLLPFPMTLVSENISRIQHIMN